MTEAANNAVHAKSDKTDLIGVTINGGNLTLKSTGTGGMGGAMEPL